MPRTNSFGQPVGPDLGDWSPPPFPEPISMLGRYVALEPLTDGHAVPLFEAISSSPESLWTYMAMGPFPDVEAMAAAIDRMNGYDDRLPFAITVD
ncbi:MAG: GNAT family N-acetyltransferase, partial [Acidimicrobiia bacterium]|nr:GNAT family N-acetyltransferase [Acidimicrobiia bacterium]